MASKKKLVHVKLSQRVKYKGPATEGPYKAFPREQYGVGEIICVPTKYFEQVIEPAEFGAIIDLDTEKREAVKRQVADLKMDELRAIVQEHQLFPEDFEGSGAGGAPTKADLLDLVETALKDGVLEPI